MPPPPAEVRAGRFVLVDDAGRERAVLEMADGEPRLQLVGANGRVQVQIQIVAVHGGAAGVYLESQDVTSFVQLAAAPHGTAEVHLGADQHRRARVSSNQAGQVPTVELTDDHGRVVGRLPALPPPPPPA